MSLTPPQTEPSNDMGAFKEVLRSSKHIIAVAGAGLSAASGIPTFRGAGGLWRKFDAMSLATPEAFDEDPSRVWQFYHYRRETARMAKPNAAHYALALMSFPSLRHEIAPGSTFTLITQNVDGLSARALAEVTAKVKASSPSSSTTTISNAVSAASGQPQMLEMHGRIHDVVCMDSKCGHREWTDASPICPALAGTEKLVDGGSIEPVIPKQDLPRCTKCGALARPGVVWFGEVPVHMETIDELVDEADLCLVVGTSSTVFPAAGYAEEVQSNGGAVAVFNLENSAGDQDADFLFLGPCERTLPEALNLRSEIAIEE